MPSAWAGHTPRARAALLGTAWPREPQCHSRSQQHQPRSQQHPPGSTLNPARRGAHPPRAEAECSQNHSSTSSSSSLAPPGALVPAAVPGGGRSSQQLAVSARATSCPQPFLHLMMLAAAFLSCVRSSGSWMTSSRKPITRNFSSSLLSKSCQGRHSRGITVLGLTLIPAEPLPTPGWGRGCKTPAQEGSRICKTPDPLPRHHRAWESCGTSQ